MFPSTSSSSFSQDLVDNLHYPRRLLLNTLSYDIKPISSSPTPAPNHQVDPSLNDGFNANLIMVLSVLLCALVCALCVNFLIRCVLKCSSFIISDSHYNIDTISHPEVNKSGLNKRALGTFPVVKYSKEVKIKGLGTDCVICLSEFRDGERVRILPKCNHGFHVKCIDKWLSSHTSCPTCRHSLVDTCQKIIGCDNHQTISSTTVPITHDFISTSIAPLEREDLARGQVAQSWSEYNFTLLTL